MENNISSEENKQGKTNPYLIPFSIIVAGAIIAGAVMYGRTSGNPAQRDNTAPQAQQTANIKNVKTAGAPYIGNATTPVTVAYWSDYQCPFCKQFETATMPKIIDNYVKTGKLKIVFKDFQFLGPDSMTAALTGRAIWELYPAHYLDWRIAMFKKQDGENGGFGDEASVTALTKTISGIDAATVTKLIAEKKDEYQKAIDADKEEGATFGIQGTPGFVTGVQTISGAVPYESFSKAIDAQLK